MSMNIIRHRHAKDAYALLTLGVRLSNLICTSVTLNISQPVDIRILHDQRVVVVPATRSHWYQMKFMVRVLEQYTAGNQQVVRCVSVARDIASGL